MHEACTCLGSPSALLGTRCTSSEQQNLQALIFASVGSAFAKSDSAVNVSDLDDHHLQVSATLLGEPDVGLLTPPEMSRKTSQICMSIPQIPVIVDADTGRAVH